MWVGWSTFATSLSKYSRSLHYWPFPLFVTIFMKQYPTQGRRRYFALSGYLQCSIAWCARLSRQLLCFCYVSPQTRSVALLCVQRAWATLTRGYPSTLSPAVMLQCSKSDHVYLWWLFFYLYVSFNCSVYKSNYATANTSDPSDSCLLWQLRQYCCSPGLKWIIVQLREKDFKI